MKMEEIQVKIISCEEIKPSTPTSPHLTSHKLSLLDQYFSVYEYRTPAVHFFAGGNVSRLRDSLSKTLSLFYPLAGRLPVEANAIDCTDEGAPFYVARANCSLSVFLGSPNRVELLPQFIPNFALDPTRMVTGLVPLVLQVTVFECGGVAIGSQCLHKTLDGTSQGHFYQTWAAIAAGREGDVVAPDFKTAVSLFPPAARGPEPTPVQVLRPVEGGGCVCKAFGFSNESIVALQDKARSERIPHPTRIEAVSGFIWKHLMAGSTIAGPSVVVHSVDMRSRLRPPLPPSTFGKFTNHAIARHENRPDQPPPDLPQLVSILHEAISEAKDSRNISKFIGLGGEEAVREHKQRMQKLKKEANLTSYTFTSWSGLNVDFGFGMPLWIGFTGGPTSSWFRRFGPLIRTHSYGIELWLVLDGREVARLESNPEFLAFASSSSTPIFTRKSSL